MEKTKRKTGGIAKFIEEAKRYRENPTVLNNIIEAMSEKIDELQAKATAYDRLMSGGKKTLKEWANLLGRPVAMDFGGVVESYNTIPMRCDSAGYWYCDEYSENFEDEHFIIPKECFDYTGSWQDSLTLPDGWEERMNQEETFDYNLEQLGLK